MDAFAEGAVPFCAVTRDSMDAATGRN
jgi:hypothetical protein